MRNINNLLNIKHMEKTTVFNVVHTAINLLTGDKTSFVTNMYPTKEQALNWIEVMFNRTKDKHKRGYVFEAHNEEWVITSKKDKDIYSIQVTKE